MASGDGSDDGSNVSGGSPTSEPGDVPPPGRHIYDPGAESVWLGRRHPQHLGRPRISTILLIIAFVALFALYIVLG
ncbi:hypothetical protein [Nocardia sp. NPDC050710]|uniref:hypothetical protein n=1 Tax=Nocardia sp. NPDC050710 TaxID=3157220 RepID=UPI0033D4437A